MLPRQTERGNGRREPTGTERSVHTHKGRQTKGVQGQELQKGLSSVRAALGALCRMQPSSILTQPCDKYLLCLVLWLQFPPGSPQLLQKKCPNVPHTALALLLLIPHGPTPVQQRREFSLINQDCVSPMPVNNLEAQASMALLMCSPNPVPGILGKGPNNIVPVQSN